ncbi:deoxynucleotidyltransferase terminal-interacting protein 1-like [Oscarella lobularis]|uniref:deoxynucleotidyltransferase terminal-interacting protein 1-like n=1 Tax=Oscarella lobularis TaxID=121494 RepID=UPI0033131BA5
MASCTNAASPMDAEHLQQNANAHSEGDAIAESTDQRDSSDANNASRQQLDEEGEPPPGQMSDNIAASRANKLASPSPPPPPPPPPPPLPSSQSQPNSPVESSTSDENVAVRRPAPLDMTKKNFPRRNRYGHRAAQTALSRTRGSGTNPMKALELLRNVLYPSFEKEVLPVCRKFMEILRMGAQNLRENTGDTVSNVHIVNALRRSLEEVGLALDHEKATALPSDFRDAVAPSAAATTMTTSTRAIASNGRTRKRKEPKDSNFAKAAAAAAPPTKASKLSQDVETSGMTWDADAIAPDTRFVMGVRANKAIGFAATRGRIYYRHPELYKYSGDQDDKVWLYDNGHMPVTGGKAYLMLEQDLIRLCESQDYVNNPTVNREELMGFQVPPFMLQKIKADMRQQRQALQL